MRKRGFAGRFRLTPRNFGRGCGEVIDSLHLAFCERHVRLTASIKLKYSNPSSHRCRPAFQVAIFVGQSHHLT